MALSHPVKLILKSTTTQTLSDRFTEMMRTKTVGGFQQTREDNIALTRASAKNRRLAEQMSRRRTAAMDKFDDEVNIKPTVRDRLGLSNNQFGNSIQTRLGRGSNFNNNRGRGSFQGSRGNLSRSSSRTSLRGSVRGSQQNRGGRFNNRGRGRGSVGGRGARRGISGRGGARGRGNMRGGFGRGNRRGGNRGVNRGGNRGGNRGNAQRNNRITIDRSDLDSELDRYMLKNEI